ncbi:hypothetical protein [Erwinia sp.]|uniref:hypothetical protein n=1 Tax=Erwinia citreus TaxID=558 RepID=UPI00289AF578|nr:hypothetical protein [Erwinia sp.]
MAFVKSLISVCFRNAKNSGPLPSVFSGSDGGVRGFLLAARQAYESLTRFSAAKALIFN